MFNNIITLTWGVITIYNINKIILFILFLILLIPSIPARSQVLDNSQMGNGHVIAIIPITSRPRGIYGDNTNFVANQLVTQLRQMPQIQTLNVLNSLRVIKNSSASKNFTSILNSVNLSYDPDPDDVYKIAEVLNADKVILVSGGFDTQSGYLYRSPKSRLNWFNKYIIKPEYRYRVQIRMYDPVSGNIVWSKSFFKGFQARNFDISSDYMSENPQFIETFNMYCQQISVEIIKDLSKYFYQGETSTVKSKILNVPGQTGEATEGAVTKDGQLILPNNQSSPNPNTAVQPQFAPPDNPTNNTQQYITQPYPNPSHNNNIKPLKPNYEEDILNQYQNNMNKKY